MSNPELAPKTERSAEIQDAAAERSKELLQSPETSGESSLENKGERADKARAETKEALLNREAGGAETRSAAIDTSPSLTHATKRQRADSYRSTMKTIQSEMSAPERAFSKVIHNKTIEKVSDTVGSTVARPNAVLSGAVVATFLSLFVFLVAKQYGYRLSGFETIGTFFVGWALGLIYDYAKLMFAPKK